MPDPTKAAAAGIQFAANREVGRDDLRQYLHRVRHEAVEVTQGTGLVEKVRESSRGIGRTLG